MPCQEHLPHPPQVLHFPLIHAHLRKQVFHQPPAFSTNTIVENVENLEITHERRWKSQIRRFVKGGQLLCKHASHLRFSLIALLHYCPELGFFNLGIFLLRKIPLRHTCFQPFQTLFRNAWKFQANKRADEKLSTGFNIQLQSFKSFHHRSFTRFPSFPLSLN